ncbi:hypothetical protein ABZ816_18765 [Actinosynnema sp. NPDC047251]|uniref:hypothetical protein n=1 Tax=Saccharothrix espanaensis TaxID=103731 RepID=UPI0002E59BE6|nr:hypothetical protein [Saccharothrix espanaensis]
MLLRALPHRVDGGSVTLTAGTFAGHLPGGISETLGALGLAGTGTPAAVAARTYRDSVDGTATGRDLVPAG